MRAEEEAKAKREKEEAKSEAAGGESADDEGESTEVEEPALAASRSSLSLSGFEEGAMRTGREDEEATARQRNVKTKAQGTDLSGETSTDSEWEKVEDGR